MDSSQTKVDVGKNFEMKCSEANKIIGDSLDPLKLLCKDGKIADMVWPLTQFSLFTFWMKKNDYLDSGSVCCFQNCRERRPKS